MMPEPAACFAEKSPSRVEGAFKAGASEYTWDIFLESSCAKEKITTTRMKSIFTIVFSVKSFDMERFMGAI